jgi:transcriptional regulator with XRE-family HTH domain
MSDPNSFGEHVRRLRGQRTRSAIAKAAEIHPIHLVKLENGQRADPRISTILRLARALGVDLNVLIAPLLYPPSRRANRVGEGRGRRAERVA